MNLTKEQTIEALKCCGDILNGDPCECCPLFNKEDCNIVLFNNTLRYLKESEPSSTIDEANSTTNSQTIEKCLEIIGDNTKDE